MCVVSPHSCFLFLFSFLSFPRLTLSLLLFHVFLSPLLSLLLISSCLLLLLSRLVSSLLAASLLFLLVSSCTSSSYLDFSHLLSSILTFSIFPHLVSPFSYLLVSSPHATSRLFFFLFRICFCLSQLFSSFPLVSYLLNLPLLILCPVSLLTSSRCLILSFLSSCPLSSILLIPSLLVPAHLISPLL